MATPIENNSEGLQRILQAVNNLPSGGSGGVNVQRTSDYFTTNSNGSATVNCGFSPDLVTIYTSTYNGSEQGFSFPFAEQQTSSTSYMTLGFGNTVYEATGSRTSNGFNITVKDSGWDWGEDPASNEEFFYIAVKYT